MTRPSIFNRIEDFNHSVVKIGPRSLSPLAPDECKWLVGALKEEAEELGASLGTTSNPEDRLVDQVDACVDTVIFAIGGLVRMGLTVQEIEEALHVVMDANFEKKAGVKPGREGAADAIKPEGWVGPEARLKGLLNV